MTSPPQTSAKKPIHPAAVGAIVVIVLVCIGCGAAWLFRGGGDKPVAAPATAAAAKTTAPASPAAACLPVPEALLALLDDQAQTGTGLKMTGRAGAVRSPDHEKMWLVAAEFTATGVPRQVGVWAVNSLDAPGAVFSVDGTAVQFTNWRDAANVDGQMRYEPAVGQARSCVK